MANDNFSYEAVFYENSSSNATSDPSYFANIHNSLAGSIIFFAVLPFMIFKFRALPFETPYFALIGATLMVWSNAVTPSEFFDVVGAREHISGFLLLLGTTIIGDYFNRERIFLNAIRHLLKEDQAFSNYLLRISCICFVVSMLFSSDLNCLWLTPVILKCWEEQERPENELNTIVLAVATSAGLGGGASVFGNVALSLFATGRPPLQTNMKSCFQHFLVPASICFWLNYGFLVGSYHLKHKRSCVDFRRPRFLKKKTLNSSRESDPEQFPNSLPLAESLPNDALQKNGDHPNGLLLKDEKLFNAPALETIVEDEVLVLPETPTLARLDSCSKVTFMRSSSATEDLTCLDEETLTSSLSSGLANSQISNARNSQAHLIEFQTQKTPLILNWEPNQSVTGFSMVHLLNYSRGFHEARGSHSARQHVFKLCLLLLQLIIVVLQIIGSFHPLLDPGLVLFGGAVAIMTIDASMNRRSSSSSPSSWSYNWSLPCMGFFSLFVLVYGFHKTDLPRWLWDSAGLSGPHQDDPHTIALLVALVMTTSNAFGFVPASLVIALLLSPEGLRLSATTTTSSTSQAPGDVSLGCSLQTVLFVSWTLSMSAMTSLTSSVANSVVAQRSQEILNTRMSYLQHLLYGLPASVLFSITGICSIYLYFHVF